MSARTISPPEYARRLGVNADKILGWINTGELEAINVASKPTGRPRWRITAEAIERFERRRSAGPALAIKPQRRRRRRDPEVIEFF